MLQANLIFWLDNWNHVRNYARLNDLQNTEYVQNPNKINSQPVLPCLVFIAFTAWLLLIKFLQKRKSKFKNDDGGEVIDGIKSCKFIHTVNNV